MSHEAEAKSRRRRKNTPSVEQYVETIAQLLKQDLVTNVSDIAEACGVSRPAASRSVQELKAKGLAEHKAYGYVSLTPKGQALAKRLHARHQTLRRFLEDILCFDNQFADLEACHLEHVVDDKVIKRINHLTSFLQKDDPVVYEALRKKMEQVGGKTTSSPGNDA